jgi:NitT/TauT family transport system permease protein
MNTQRNVVNRLALLDQPAPRWTSAIAILALLIVWELTCHSGWVPEVFLPSPLSILATGWKMLQSGELIVNGTASLIRIAAGFLIGGMLGIALGLILGFSKLAEAIGNPVIHALYPIPKLALLPLIILWLGIGEVSKISIIALGVFFPVIINTYSGVKGIDPLLIKVAVSFRATRSNIIRKVILPGALPVIFAGLKLAAGTALLLLVAAEMIAAKEGIGAMILHYGDLMLTNKLMVGILTLSLFGLVFNRLLEWLERRVISWKQP